MTNRFFALAKKLATKSDHHQHKLGCVIVNKGDIVSCGFNQIKTHPKSLARYNMLHAEIDALLGTDLQETLGATAYVYRETKDGTLAMARPCEGCMKALKAAGIRKLCYTINNGVTEEYAV